MNDKGIVYVAVGDLAYECALLSLETVREHMGSIGAMIVTNIKDEYSPFDFVETIEDQEYDPGLKIKAIMASRFEYTLHLDVDTFVCMSVSEIFDVLETHDAAGSMRVQRISWPTLRPVPRLFPEIEPGVLAIKKSKCQNMLDDWLDVYSKLDFEKHKKECGALRDALYHSDIRLCILPPEFNLSVMEPCCLGGGPVYVLHGAKPDRKVYETIRRQVNSIGNPRLYEPDRSFVKWWTSQT